MVEIIFGAEAIRENPALISLINISSPRRLDDRMLEALTVYAKARQAVIITPFILSGAMAPVSVAGTLIQQNAEALAGIAYAQMVQPGTPVVYGSFMTNVDLKSNARLLPQYAHLIPERKGWEARYWSPIQGAEHLATRLGAALYELSSFVKIEVSGPGAAEYLEYLSANRVAREVGKVIYTSLLTDSGGIKCDLTITRLAEDRFWVLTGGGSGMSDLEWIRRNTPSDGSVYVEDVSSKYTSVGLWGPKARRVLEFVCEQDISNEAFPYFTAQEIMIETAPALALRISYVGELGWEIYTPTEYGLRLWDVLWEAGQVHGIIAAGMGAFNSLRLEKGYRALGMDIHPDYNPFEAGLNWAVRLDQDDFKGKAVGYVTSSNYGYSVGKQIAYGYLPVEYAEKRTQVEIEYFGKRLTATVSDDPQYDAKMEKIKA